MNRFDDGLLQAGAGNAGTRSAAVMGQAGRGSGNRQERHA